MMSKEQKILEEIQSNIQNAKKRRKHSKELENQVRSIIRRLHVIVNNQTSNVKETVILNHSFLLEVSPYPVFS